MKAILDQMNIWDHCPKCGGLLFRAETSRLCAHCGYEETETGHSFMILGVGFNENTRYHLSDDCPDWIMDEAA